MPRIEKVIPESGEPDSFKICIDSVEDGKKLIRQIKSTLYGHDDQEAGKTATMMAPAGANYSINLNC